MFNQLAKIEDFRQAINTETMLYEVKWATSDLQTAVAPKRRIGARQMLYQNGGEGHEQSNEAKIFKIRSILTKL